MQTIHQSGRVQVLDAPVALPGKCVQCGSSTNSDGRKFVDIGFELDYYGVIYFCTHCLTELSNALGYANPEQVKDLEDRLSEIVDHVARIEAENVKLRNALSNLDFLGIKQSSTVEKSEIKPAAKSGSTKPSNESGRTNVRETKSTGKSSVPDEFEEFGI